MEMSTASILSTKQTPSHAQPQSDEGKAALDYNDEADNTLPTTPSKSGAGAGSGGKNKSNKSTSSSASTSTKSFASNTRELFATASESIPAGELKSFSDPMADAYQPQLVEANWDTWWEMNNLYKPVESSDAEPFVMVIPPPNVTGVLHIGHGLTGSIEDALARYMRMNGRNTLWIPGSDHAGIATQVVVEKKLARESNGTVTRHTLGREKFEAEVFKWKDNNGNIIYQQFRRLGVSTDWSREAFTMNDMLSNAVKQAFIRLHNKGVIYRANRIVNWSCTLRTAISNLEVEYIELDGSTMIHVPAYDKPIEFGVLHSFAYKVLDDNNQATDEEIIVATTRIETMLGDVAVAVHPNDERYKHLHNKYLQHPFIASRKVRIVTDDVLVDMSFGTGAVKVTPAHDPNDFACGKRHKLDEINILTDDGLVNSNGGKLFEGMKRFEAREAVINELKKLNLYRGKSNNKMSIGICSRSKDIVEPIVRPQWWMNCKGAAKRAIDAVKNGQLKLIPNSHEKIWFHWLENIQDWCISRQIWWGHRIPAYHVTINTESNSDVSTQMNGTSKRSDDDSSNDEMYWIVAEDEDAAMSEAVRRFNVDQSAITLRRDEDVLDTWFSSGLFPFSTLGWPNPYHNGGDMKRFFPTTLLETGHDILFFWVARMVFMSFELTDQLPFHTVYLHAMIRDKFGRKMSKSLGNVIDPLDVVYGIELSELQKKLEKGNLDPREVEKAKVGQTQQFPNGIAECGADALRFGLLAYTAQGEYSISALTCTNSVTSPVSRSLTDPKGVIVANTISTIVFYINYVGRDINLDIQRVVAYRQFGNKLWQVTKFAMKYFKENDDIFQVIADTNELQKHLQQHSTTNANYYILHQLYVAIERATKSWNNFDFSDVTTAVYNFWLYELCDVYVECIKPVMSSDNKEARRVSLTVLHLCLSTGLKLLHPLMPFITEELWHRIPTPINNPVHHFTPQQKQCGSIMIQKYPTTDEFAIFNNPQLDSEYQSIVKEVVKTSRSIRNGIGLTKQRVDLHVTCGDRNAYRVVSANAGDIATLGVANSVIAIDTSNESEKHPSNCLSVAVNSTTSVHVPLNGSFDVGALLVKMEKETERLQSSVDSLQKQMSIPNYEQKIKAEVREKNAEKLQADSAELNKSQAFIHRLLSAMTSEQIHAYIDTKIDDRRKNLEFTRNKIETLSKGLSSERSKWAPKTRNKIEEMDSEVKRLQDEIEKLTIQQRQKAREQDDEKQ